MGFKDMGSCCEFCGNEFSGDMCPSCAHDSQNAQNNKNSSIASRVSALLDLKSILTLFYAILFCIFVWCLVDPLASIILLLFAAPFSIIFIILITISLHKKSADGISKDYSSSAKKIAYISIALCTLGLVFGITLFATFEFK